MVKAVNRDEPRALVALWVVLSVSLLLMGTVHWETVLAMTALTGVASWWLSRGLARDWPSISTLFLGLAAWTLVTAIPLPRFVLRSLSPSSDALWSMSLSPFGLEGPGWAPISLDSSASLLEAAKWGAYACIAALSAHVVRARRIAYVLFALWGSAVVLACVSIFQAVSGLDTVLGAYRPLSHRGPHRFLSLLLNPNNLAAYCNVGTLCGLGLLASRRSVAPAPLVLVGASACFATTILTGSRGGVFFLLMGLLALAALRIGALLRKRSSVAQDGLRQLVPATGLLVVGATIAVLGSTSALWQELFSRDLSKGAALGRLLPALGDYWSLGIGRGAFESSSFLLLGQSANVVWQRVENFPLSWLLEWGLPMGGAALALCVGLLRPHPSLLLQRPTDAAAYVTLLVLVGQNLVDLGFEVFSIAAAAAALAGAVSVRVSASPTQQLTVPSPWKSSLPRVSAVLVLACSLWALPRGPGLQRVRLQLFEDLAQAQGADASVRQALQDRLAREMAARPAEPYFPLIGAMLALRQGENALPWAAAALRRAPHWGRAHFAVGEALAASGATGQAFLSYRLAVQGDAALTPSVAARAIELSRRWRLLKTVIPEGPAGTSLALALRSKLPEEERLLRRKLLLRAETLDPGDQRVLGALGFAHLRELEEGLISCPEEGNCSRESREAIKTEVERIAAALGDTRQCEGLRMRAQLLALGGQPLSAFQELARCAECSLPEECARLRIRIASSLDSALRRQAELEYIAVTCDAPARCARAQAYVGNLAASRGAWLIAHEHFVQAARREPSGAHWLSAARAALQAGQAGKAQTAYRNALNWGQSDERLEAAITSDLPFR